jgi:transcriptional regulator with XRE-family HTH domain
MGVTQDQLAAAIGVTFQQVQKYERGANRVGASRLYRLRQVLDVDIEFFYGEGDAASAGGFAESPPEPFDSGPLRRRETVELVNAYHDVADLALRRQFLELAKSLASNRPEPRRRKRISSPGRRDRA